MCDDTPRLMARPLRIQYPGAVCATSEPTWLKMNVAALAAGNTQNLLTLRAYDNRCFRNAAATKATGRTSRDDVLTKGNKQLYLLRWLQIGNWRGPDEDPDCASRTHETTVALDDERSRVLRCR